jgi:hypothetical protein
MPTYELSITLRSGGQVVSGFPVLRRVEVDEAQAGVTDLASAANSSTWTAVPAFSIDTLTFLFVSTDRPITVRLNDAVDALDRAVIPLNAGGLLVLIDTTIAKGAGSANARMNNVSGSTALVRSFGGGT